MKIYGPAALNPVRRLESDRNDITPAEAPRSAEAGEKVAVSGVAEAVAEARSPEVIDQARVERIREAIAKNRFPIDPMRIARKMLTEER
ncbi:MAG: flagellar biosynthesis anti-sigma factor FlgM [Myxococcota bacterium]